MQQYVVGQFRLAKVQILPQSRIGVFSIFQMDTNKVVSYREWGCKPAMNLNVPERALTFNSSASRGAICLGESAVS
jgi:hypothetical protein